MSAKFDTVVKKFMVIFLILTVSAAGYCGFFVKWAFRDGASGMGFEAMLEGTATRPAVHRQLLPQTVLYLTDIMPEEPKEKLAKRLIADPSIEKRYAQAHIPEKYVIEYYLMYFISFLSFFAAIWVLRSLLCEIVQDKVAGTLGAVLFAVIFPYFEVLGGYFYDIAELLFMFLVARFALHGNWIGVLVLAPIAEFNKESFFFFLATLLPLFCQHYGFKKSAVITLGSMFLAGVVYLFIREAYAGNPGGMTEWHAWDHLKLMFQPKAYFKTSSIYGLPLGSGMFLPHMICVAWIVKKNWHYLSDMWKNHAKIGLVLNSILYFFFVVPDEIRDLSILYISFLSLTAFYIRHLIQQHYGVK